VAGVEVGEEVGEMAVVDVVEVGGEVDAVAEVAGPGESKVHQHRHSLTLIIYYISVH